MEHLFRAGRDSPEHSTTEGRTLYTSWLCIQGGRWHFKQKGSTGPGLGRVAGELQCCHVSETSDGCCVRAQGREAQILGSRRLDFIIVSSFLLS